MRTRIPVLLIAAGAVILVALAAWFLLPKPSGRQGTLTLGGPFALTDQHGRPFTEANLRGKLALVYFGFTFCPDICPTELQTISTALDKLGADAAQVLPVFITVDPERDTPAILAAYLKDFSPRLIGLTGTKAQIAAAAKAYRVYYARAPVADGADPDTYTVDHTNIVYLMGRDGRYLTHFSLQTQPDEMVRAIRAQL